MANPAHVDGAQRASSRRALDAISLALLLVPVALLVLMGVKQRWIGDDGFINLRVADHILHGHGFVFNAGERVEAVTSPLWLFCLVLAGALFPSLEQSAVVLGIMLSAIGLLSAQIAGFWSLREQNRGPLLVFPAGALLFSAVPGVWDYVTSALENGLSFAWLGLAILLLSRASRLSNIALYLTGAWISLGPLVRPDHGIFSLAFGLVLLFEARSRSRAAVVLSLASLLSVALVYQVFRMGYFAALVPNTALAKEAFEARWSQGQLYLANFVRIYELTWPVLLLLGVWGFNLSLANRKQRERLTSIALVVSAFLHAIYVMRVGGDFMHARMLLPAFFALTQAQSVIAWSPEGAVPRWVGRVTVVSLCAFSLYCASSLRVAKKNDHGIGDERGWHMRQAGLPNPVELHEYRRFFFYDEARKLKERVARRCRSGIAALAWNSPEPCRPLLWLDPIDGRLSDARSELALDPSSVDPSVVAVASRRPLGIAGRLVGPRVHLVDLYGLADPFAARLELSGRGRPGHEKEFSSEWIAARYAAAYATRDPRVLAARRALHCGDLAELERATKAPLTFARFMKNLALAPRFHRLRIARDPYRAEARFCRPRTPFKT